MRKFAEIFELEPGRWGIRSFVDVTFVLLTWLFLILLISGSDRAFAQTVERSYRVVVMPTAFLDGNPPAELPGLADGCRRVASMWKEYSAGADCLEFDVMPTFKVPRETPVSTCDYMTWNNLPLAAAMLLTTPGTHEWFLHPKLSCPAWPNSAQAPRGGNVVWFNGEFNEANGAHEHGHNRGLGHASGLSCGLAEIAARGTAGCTVRERADRYSVMGGSWGHPTFNEKRDLGYVGAANTINLGRTPTVADFQLEPEELNRGLMNVSVQREDGRVWNLELRTPFGYDAQFTQENAIPARLEGGGWNAWVGDMRVGGAVLEDPEGGVRASLTGPTSLHVEVFPPTMIVLAPTPAPTPEGGPIVYPTASAECWTFQNYLRCSPTPTETPVWPTTTPTPSPTVTSAPTSPSTPTPVASSVPTPQTPDTSTSPTPTATARPVVASATPTATSGGGKPPWWIAGVLALAGAIYLFFKRRGSPPSA